MKNIILLAITVIFMSSCTQKQKTDLILHSGKVYTVDSSFTVAECIVVDKGKILDVGTDKDMLGKYTSDNKQDLDGKFVYPGFIDPHCHFYAFGKSLRDANLKGTKSFDEIIELIQEHHNKYPSPWITGKGWDQNDWEVKEFPNKEKLDELYPDLPVVLVRIDGHAVLANSLALERAGINEKSEIEGGEIIKENGKLTGVLIDKAADIMRDAIPYEGFTQSEKDLINAQEKCFEVGLTTVSDAGLEMHIIDIIDKMQKKKELKMRIYAMLSPTEENIEKYLKNGIYKTDFLNVRSLKLYADGALGSRGAALIEPYSDKSNSYGLLVTPADTLKAYSKLAMDNNYQVITHAIGDSANRTVLNIYSEFLEKGNDLRWRIEHAQLVHPDDINKFGEYSVIPCVQTTHATSDMYWADERLGKERIKTAYAYSDLLKQNGWIPNGSDFPIEDINPIYGFYSAVARKDFEGYPEGGFQPENALTREQALRAMTIWAAKSNFEENEKGSIEKGKFADITITDEDLITAPENKLFKIKVLQTIINGETVFERK